MKEIFERNKISIIVCSIFSLIALGSISFGVYKTIEKPVCASENTIDSLSLAPTEEKVVDEVFYVEVKGAVKKPGVYEANDGQIINDIIKASGGFKKTSYTDNINLSKKVSSEMVIYVYTKTEYKKLNIKTTESKSASSDVCTTTTYSTDNCIKNGASIITPGTSDTTFKSAEESTGDNNEVANGPININIATIDELTSLNGIGQSKAESIIAYRNENGLFKTIEEITNVSGIGNSVYEKIKDFITV